MQEISLEYICLNPATALNRIIEQASKVILASGTLEPAGDFDLIKAQKFRFTCGHIIKPDQFRAVCLDAGFNFAFD